MRQAEAIKTFFSVVAPGFTLDGELPVVELEGIEERHDGHAIARVRADGDNPNPGMGVRFVNLRPDERERLVEVIRTIAYVRDPA